MMTWRPAELVPAQRSMPEPKSAGQSAPLLPVPLLPVVLLPVVLLPVTGHGRLVSDGLVDNEGLQRWQGNTGR